MKKKPEEVVCECLEGGFRLVGPLDRKSKQRVEKALDHWVAINGEDGKQYVPVGLLARAVTAVKQTVTKAVREEAEAKPKAVEAAS